MNGQPPAAWRNRIVRSGDAPLDQITPNPANWRTHPQHQKAALSELLDSVGYVQQVVINERSGRLVDGHLRVALAEQHGESSVPAVWVDLDDDEERLILATLDPLSALAETDAAQLSALLASVSTSDDALAAMLATLGALPSIYDLPSASGAGQAEPRPSLADRFLVPPFSVLDARQGYWQSRKAAWLALGIESELGRGDVPPGGGTGAAALSIDAVRPRAAPEGNGLLGFSEQARLHYAEPGGSRP